MSKNLKKALALGMTAVVAVSAAACGKNDKKSDSKKDAGSEYGYKVEYIPLSTAASIGNGWIGHINVADGNAYFAEEVYSEDGMSYTIYVEGFSLSDPGEIKKYLTFEHEESDNTYTSINYVYPDKDGNITIMQETYTYDGDWEGEGSNGIDLGDIPENDPITEEYLSLLGIDLSEYGLEFSDVSTMTVKEVADLYESLSGGGETPDASYADNSQVLLITYDESGKEIESKDISENFTDFYAQNYVLGKDGMLYMYSQSWDMNGDEQKNNLGILNTETAEMEILKINDVPISSITATGSGDLVAAVENDEGGISFWPWDSEKKKFTEDDKNTSVKDVYWIDDTSPASADSFYYVADSTLYQHDMGKKKSTKLFRFVDWDISGDSFPAISYVDEDNLIIISTSYKESGTEMVINKVTRVKASEIKKKTEIVLGCFDTYSLQDAIIDFNKKNSEYKIVLKEFADEDTEWDTAISNFNQAVSSGEGIDLIDLSSLNITNYENKGLFEDLYSYINSDADFSKKNLNQNVLKLLEDNGKLMAIPSHYSINGLVSAKDLLGDDALTLDKFAEIIKNNPDKEILSYATRESMLYSLYSGNIGSFVDFSKKTCNFTDGSFEKVLNIASNFMSEEEYYENIVNDTDETSEPKKIADGKLLFYSLNMYDVSEYQILPAIFPDGFNVTGYPSSEGSGISVNAYGNLLAISTKSKYKDVCWEFIKSCLESGNNMYGGFSIDNDKLDETLKEASTPVMVDDGNGNLVEGSMGSYGFGDFEVELKALSEEQVKDIKELVNSVSVLSTYNDEDDIMNIITEESAAFFAGEKSAADVCSVIQSRVNILINEDN